MYRQWDIRQKRELCALRRLPERGLDLLLKAKGMIEVLAEAQMGPLFLGVWLV